MVNSESFATIHDVVIALVMLNSIAILIVKIFIYLFIYCPVVSYVIFVSAHNWDRRKYFNIKILNYYTLHL